MEGGSSITGGVIRPNGYSMASHWLLSAVT
jgi:hypothetical protein